MGCFRKGLSTGELCAAGHLSVTAFRKLAARDRLLRGGILLAFAFVGESFGF